MRTSLLDYYKLILSKVSFDPCLFTKEYKKAQAVLKPDDAVKLDRWMEAEDLYACLKEDAYPDFCPELVCTNREKVFRELRKTSED